MDRHVPVWFGRTFKCSTAHTKRSFHRAINAIFGKIGRLAAEEVILELVKKNKCTVCHACFMDRNVILCQNVL